jgi:hypothetical protein
MRVLALSVCNGSCGCTCNVPFCLLSVCVLVLLLLLLLLLLLFVLVLCRATSLVLTSTWTPTAGLQRRGEEHGWQRCVGHGGWAAWFCPWEVSALQ